MSFTVKGKVYGTFHSLIRPSFINSRSIHTAKNGGLLKREFKWPFGGKGGMMMGIGRVHVDCRMKARVIADSEGADEWKLNTNVRLRSIKLITCIHTLK
jgi:hypothetical protein